MVDLDIYWGHIVRDSRLSRIETDFSNSLLELARVRHVVFSAAILKRSARRRW